MDVLHVTPVPSPRHPTTSRLWADLPARVSRRHARLANDRVSTTNTTSRWRRTSTAEEDDDENENEEHFSTPALTHSLSPTTAEDSEPLTSSSTESVSSGDPTTSAAASTAAYASDPTTAKPPDTAITTAANSAAAQRSSLRSSMPFRGKWTRHLRETLSPQQAYLSYHDILLTYEDIKALKNDWLTDNNIAFWEEWLEREILCKYPQAHVILLRPSMTFLLMKEPDLRQVVSALPDFKGVTHVFLPINDNRNVAQAEGGSHWSLLLVSAVDGVAFHYDSLGGANYAEARVATDKMGRVLGRPLRFLNLDDSPQQENGSDCGVFVCILMRHLLVNRLLRTNSKERVSMSMANKSVDSHGGRKEMLRIIEGLRKEGERRRSRSASPFSSKTPPRIE